MASKKLVISFCAMPQMEGKSSITIFGKISQGFNTIEKIQKADKEELKIIEVAVLKNPFRDTISEILYKDWQILHE